jgi:RNA polymerase sigma factor (sigma-70 family)
LKDQMPATTATLPPFGSLVEAHADAVARFLRGMLGPEDAEDALQETLLAALRAYPRFDGANPRAWLLTIARRKAIDEGRAARRRPGRLAEPDSHPGPPSRSAAFGASGSVLWEAVGRLPAKQRAAVVLRFALDLRYREIGLALDCSEEAARRSVHEAIKSLRKSDEIDPEVAR